MKSLKLFIATVCTASTVIFSACINNSGNSQPAENAETVQATDEVSSNVHVLAKGEVFDVNATPECLTIVDFNATWCGPCKAFGPVFDAASVKYAGKVKFISVDVDIHEELAKSLEISSIPAILFIHPDGTKDWSIGLMDEEEFYGKIDSALGK